MPQPQCNNVSTVFNRSYNRRRNTTPPKGADTMQTHEPEIIESRGVPYDFVPMEPRAHIIISEQAFAELKAKGFYHFATVKSERLYYFFANTPELEAELAANYQASRDYQQGGL